MPGLKGFLVFGSRSGGTSPGPAQFHRGLPLDRVGPEDPPLRPSPLLPGFQPRADPGPGEAGSEEAVRQQRLGPGAAMVPAPGHEAGRGMDFGHHAAQPPAARAAGQGPVPAAGGLDTISISVDQRTGAGASPAARAAQLRASDKSWMIFMTPPSHR